MSPRLAVVVGLLAGIICSAALVAVVYLNAPSISATLWPSPTPSAGTAGEPTPSVGAAASIAPTQPAAPSASPGATTGASDSSAGSTPGAGGPGSGSGTPVASAAPSASVSGLQTNFLIGQPAPKLVLPLVGGGTIDLASLKGKPVWVNFMGTYCPPCRDEFPVMNSFAVRYAQTGLVVLAVDIKEDEGTIASFAHDLNVTFPIALDHDGSAQRTWKVVALPIHFWIDTKGIVRFGALGGIGPDLMAKALGTILPGVDVTP